MRFVPPVAAAAGLEPAGDSLWSISSLSAPLLVLAILGEVLAVLFVYRVLVRGGSASGTLLWMAVILLAPWLGLALYYLLPRRLQLRRLRRLQQRERHLREVRPDGSGGPQGPDPDGPVTGSSSGLAALLRARGGLSAGNQLRWLPSGSDFFTRSAEAVRRATRHVHCVVYILRPDETGLAFLAMLTDAAERGVQVRLCYDSVGSWGLKSSHLSALRAAGGRAVPFLPLLWKRRPFTLNLRNHRKLLIVDGEVAFVGGRNIADEYRHDRWGKERHWLDVMMELRGPAVDCCQDIFVQDWATAADEVLGDTFREPPAPPGDNLVAIVGGGPDQAPSDLSFALVQAMAEASGTIELSSPYLVLPPILLHGLQLAAARGVRVRIYTNGSSAEAAILYHAQRHHYRGLLRAGIEVFETVGEYNHAKLLVVDHRTVFVGSANMDLRSAHLNFEIAAVAIEAPGLAAEVQATLAERQRDFRQVTRQALPKNPVSRALDGLCGLFSPLL